MTGATRVACSTSAFASRPLEEALAEVRALGFDSVDLFVIEGWAHVQPSALVSDYEATLARVQRALAAAQLTPVALNIGVGPKLQERTPAAVEARIAQTRAVVRLMSDLGVPVGSVLPREADPALSPEAQFEAYAASLREMTAIAAEAGVVFALEPHVGSIAEAVPVALRLLDAAPGLTVTYDPSHPFMQGLTLEESLPLMERAGHVHLRDAAPGRMQTPMGQGAIPWEALLGALKERGYGGPIAIEYLESRESDIRQDIRTLRDLIARYI